MGNVTTFDYNGIGERVKKTNPDGSEVKYTYDLNRRLISITNEDGLVTHFSYDAADRRTALILPGGATAHYHYNPDGLMDEKTDPLGRKTQFEYDAAGRLTASIAPDGRKVEINHDSSDRKTSVKDSLGHITTFAYDAVGMLKSVTDPLGRIKTYEYDRAGRVVSLTDAKGSKTTYTYDEAARLTKKQYTDNRVQSFTYDAAGHLLKVLTSDVTISYAYDVRGLLTAINNDTLGLSVGYTYDVLGRKVSVTYPDGEMISYNRNQRGFVTGLSTSLPGTLPNPVVTYNYSPAGILASSTYGFGLSAERTYDTAGRLDDLKWRSPSEILSDFAYSYDDAGNILSKACDFGSINYTYDDMNRLTGAEYSWKGAESFTYDALGDRASSNLYDTWNYDTAGELLSYGNGSQRAASFTYDSNGSVVLWTDENGDKFDFTYNGENRIAHVDKNNEPLADYVYDHIGQRVKKVLYEGGSQVSTTRYIYGTEGLLAEYDGGMNLIKKCVWNTDPPWGTGPLWQANSAGNRHYYINDHLFTPQKMVDEGFNTVWQGLSLTQEAILR